LREQLTRNGHVLRSESDTETIVHLYEDFGPRCVDHLRGMFAFAIWDTRRRELLLARDRLGIKPLYYAEIDWRHRLRVGVEADPAAARKSAATWIGKRSAICSRSWRRRRRGALSMACASSSPAGSPRRLPGDRCGSTGIGMWTSRRTSGASEGDLADELQALLREAVRIHQISDVPLGAFLSGGIDSSAVVATMAGLSTGKVKDVLDRLRRGRVRRAGARATRRRSVRHGAPRAGAAARRRADR
jgi:asparagine synthase (glutamine-hydrolysing)